ncbi:unnamed protein product [Absidia cylindrospora]
MTDTTNTTEDTSKKDMKKFERWTKSLQYLTGLGMDETERKAFRNKLDIELEDYQCQQCERWKTNLIKNNPPVRFMMDEMKKIGRNVTKEDFHCMPCDEQDLEDSRLMMVFYCVKTDWEQRQDKNIQWFMKWYTCMIITNSRWIGPI